MRFMMLVKANKDTEAGKMPSEKELAEMAKYNEQLVNDGIMLAGDGLQPSSKGARVRFSGGKPTVTDGPFTETKELVAGYWVIRANSRQEAIELAKKVPFVDGEIEIRQVFELEDFGSSDAIDHHRQLQDRLAKQ